MEIKLWQSLWQGSDTVKFNSMEAYLFLTYYILKWILDPEKFKKKL